MDVNCPPECKVKFVEVDRRLASIESRIDKVKNNVQENYSHWEEAVSRRVKTATLIAISTVVIGVVCSMFVIIYAQGERLTKDVHQIQIRVAEVKTLVDYHMEATDQVRGRKHPHNDEKD